MVEFALVSPLVVMAIFMTIDAGRLMYAYNSISSATREGARILSLRPQLYSDCYALKQMEAIGQAFPLVPDPNSVAGGVNTDPNNSTSPNGPTIPPVGVGYIYIWPAVATAAPQDATTAGVRNCDSPTERGGTANNVKNVAVQIEYHFHPLTPIVSQLIGDSITVKTISEVQTEY